MNNSQLSLLHDGTSSCVEAIKFTAMMTMIKTSLPILRCRTNSCFEIISTKIIKDRADDEEHIVIILSLAWYQLMKK